MQVFHEQDIKKNIDNNGPDQEMERSTAVAKGAKYGGAEIVQHGCTDAHEDEKNITVGIIEDLFRCVHQAKQIICPEEADSLYQDRLSDWFNREVNPDWSSLVSRTMHLLQVESELDEIVRLVGIDALSFKDRLTLEAARSIREDYLHQNAFHETDTYTSPKKQYMMLHTILFNYEKCLEALEHDALFSKLMTMPVLERIGRLKYVPEEEVEKEYKEILNDIKTQTETLSEGGTI